MDVDSGQATTPPVKGLAKRDGPPSEELASNAYLARFGVGMAVTGVGVVMTGPLPVWPNVVWVGWSGTSSNGLAATTSSLSGWSGRSGPAGVGSSSLLGMGRVVDVQVGLTGIVSQVKGSSTGRGVPTNEGNLNPRGKDVGNVQIGSAWAGGGGDPVVCVP
jgi:hypothetical protein